MLYYDSTIAANELAAHLGRAEVMADGRIALYAIADWLSSDGEPEAFVYPLSVLDGDEDNVDDDPQDGDVVWNKINGVIAAVKV